MKKTDVYVKIDTPKKAKKLKRLLDMFGEKLYLNEILYNFTDERRLLHYWYGNFSLATRCLIDEHNKTKVSIKELRNILAKEHLKAGDVCLFDDRKGFRSIGVFDKYSEEYTDFLVSKVPGKDSVRYGFHDFIRYATEEEKALLEPKKELDIDKENINYEKVKSFVGKWIHALDKIVFVEEAKRRGFKAGDKVISAGTGDECEIRELSYFYCHSGDWMSVEGATIYSKGQWSTVIEQDKLSSLKEAFSKGYCVEFYDEKTDTWKRHENPCWNPDLEWRIMVNNGHLVVSDVYLLNQIKELKKSIEEIKSNIK